MAEPPQVSGWIEYPLIREASAELERTLVAGEELYLNVPRHPACLWKPVALSLLIGAVVLTTIADGELPSGLLLIALVLSLAWLAWEEAERRHETFVATDQRILKIEGLIAKRTPVMRRGKVTDLSLRRSLIGRICNYGTIMIESAGQDQALNKIEYVRYPSQTFRRLNALTSGQIVVAHNPRPGGAALVGRKVRKRARGTEKPRRPVPMGDPTKPVHRAAGSRDVGPGPDTDEFPPVRRPEGKITPKYPTPGEEQP